MQTYVAPGFPNGYKQSSCYGFADEIIIKVCRIMNAFLLVCKTPMLTHSLSFSFKEMCKNAKL